MLLQLLKRLFRMLTNWWGVRRLVCGLCLSLKHEQTRPQTQPKGYSQVLEL